MNFDEFDKKKIEETRQILWKVYECNYGDPSVKRETDRLATIIRKIDELLNIRRPTP